MHVAILSPGDMGHAVGMVLNESGARAVTCLAGRSERTHELARKAGFDVVADLHELVTAVDVVLSITAPAQAADVIAGVAEALRATGAAPVVVDCNAVSPETARALDGQLDDTNARFVDGSIIGPPPRARHTTRFYVSGPAATELEKLRDYGLGVRPIGSVIGQASALKMSYAAITKGVTALATQLLVTARSNDVYDELLDEFGASVPELLAFVERQLPAMPAKSRRWINEMEEIARTFEAAGLPGAMFQGAAGTYRLVGETALADETPETRDRERGMVDVVEALAAHVAARGTAER